MSRNMKRILTLALAMIMTLGSVSGAIPTAYADEEIFDGSFEAPEPGVQTETEPEPEPSEAPADEPGFEYPEYTEEEPAEDDRQQDESEHQLDVSLIVSDEAELCLKTEGNVIAKETYPAIRLWTNEESLKYFDFAESLSGEEIVIAGAVYDAMSFETGIRFTEREKVYVTGGAVGNGGYSLYLAEGEELKAAELNREGDVLIFDAEELSLLVLTRKITENEAEEETGTDESEEYLPILHDKLVEVEATDNEPLLQIDELSDETIAALGIEIKAPSKRGTEAGGVKQGDASSPMDAEGDENETGEEEPEEEPEEENRLPWVSETVSIESLTFEWKAVTYNQHVDPIYRDLVCDTDYVPDLKFQIDISLNGDEIIQPGALELVFPAYLWKNRDGEEAGRLYLSVPAEPDHDAEFAWRRAGDSIIITNTHKMTSTSRIMIQAAFRNIKANEMLDGTDSRTFNDFFNVQANLTNSEGITLTRIGNQHFKENGEPETQTVPVLDENGEQVYDEEGNVVTKEEYIYTPIYATIDTHAAAKVLTKNAVNPYIENEYYTYFSVPAELPAEYLPENPEKYAYARWTIRAIASGSQPYTMTLTDTVGSRYGDMILCADGLNKDIYGVETMGPDEGTNGKRITITLFEGYTTNARSVVIWTAYPKSTMREGVPYYVENSAKLTVIGQDDEWDGVIEHADFENKGEMFREGVDYTVTTDEYGDSRTKSALVKEIEVSAKARVQLPITYRITKQWDDNDNEKGHRPTSQYFIIYRDGRIWQYIYLREMDNAVAEDQNNPGQYIHTWTYEWDDGGQQHTYDVEERYLSSGYEHKDFYNGDEGFDPGEDEDYREYYRWYYVQSSRRYSSSTHTWTFTNKYQEESYRVYRYPYVWRRKSLSVSKRQYSYYYSDKTNSYDKLLNLLRRGESIIIPYSLWTSAEIYELTYDGPDTAEEWKKVENYGKKTARAELEEGEMYLTDEVNFPQYDRVLEPGEYDIESINVSGFTVYDWRQDYLRDENGNYVVDEDGNYVPDPFVEWSYHSNYELTAETELQILGCSYENGAWGEWKLCATMLNGTITPVMEGVSVNGWRVTFPAGIHKVKTRVDSKAGEIYMGYTANIRVYPADSLKPFIEEAFEHNYAETYAMVSVRNVDEARILNPGDAEPDMELNYEATAYIHGRNFRTAASLDKEYVFSEEEGTYFEYNESKQEFIFTNRVNLILQSTVLEGNLFTEFVGDGTLPNTKGGTFYDLLPEGVEPVLESIKVGVYSDDPNEKFTDGSGEDKVIDAYTIENFRNSGKTLLVVKVSFNDHFSYANEDMTEYNRSMDPAHYPKNGWRNTHTLFYQSKCVSSEAESRAVNGMIPLFTNAAAFEADEETIASLKGWQGEPDDPTEDNNLRSLSEMIVGDKNYTGIMTDLDPDRDSRCFVYASASVDLTAAVIQATFYGRKEASSDGIKWSTGELNDIFTYEGTTYSYRLRMEIEAGGAAGDIVFYDPFDAYRYLPGSTKYDGKGYWVGSLLNVDVTQLQSLGIAPVVYYYYGEGAVPETLDDLLDAGTSTLWESEGWTSDPADFENDFSRVKAVAVDARYDKDGNEYVAQGWEEVIDEYGETQIVNGRRELVVYLHMRAPLGEAPFAESEDRFDPDENAHAYNVNYIYAQIKKGQQAGLARWNATNATKVGIIPYKIELEKIWDDLNDNDAMRPEEITLSLYGNGELVETITVTADEEGKWRGTFMHVRRFDDEYNPIEYTIVEEPIEGYNDSEAFPEAKVERLEFDESKQSFTVTNHHDRIQTSVPFEKRWDLTLGGDDSADRPETIIVDLYRWVETTVTDEETGEEHTEGDWQPTGARKIVRADADGNWSGSFDNVWKFEDGREIIYTVRETPVYKYITEYDESVQNDPVIINTYYPFGDLLITKEVVHATAAALEKGSFTFDLVLKYNGEEVGELYNYVKTHADGTTETGRILGVSSFTLKAGETLLIKDIRSETDYELYEHPSSGYTIQRKSGDTGVISAGETKNALFVNRYDSSAFVALNVTKELTGRALAGYQFKFEIKDAEGNLLGIAYNAASADATVAGGSAPVTLQNLNYTSEDDGKTYYYTVNEVKPENAPDYYVYDERIFGVSVAVTDNGDGTLTTNLKYLGVVSEGADLAAVAASITESAEAPVFRNQYHAYGEVILKTWKTLRGGNLDDYAGIFKFEVLDENGTRLFTAGNDSDGVVEFPVLEYDETDAEKTYLYIVREINTGDPRVIYDDSVFGYTVRVIDTGEGILTFRRGITAVKWDDETEKYVIDLNESRPDPIFHNFLEDGNLTVSKSITWADSITDEDSIAALQNKEFTFKIRFFGEILPNNVEAEAFYIAHIIRNGSLMTYDSLEEAFADARDGEAIFLDHDTEVTSPITIKDKYISIEAENYIINNSVHEEELEYGWYYGTTSILLLDGAGLTVNGGVWQGNSCSFEVYANDAQLIINSGSFLNTSTSNYSSYNSTIFNCDGRTIINGGFFDGKISISERAMSSIVSDVQILGGTFRNFTIYKVNGPGYSECNCIILGGVFGLSSNANYSSNFEKYVDKNATVFENIDTISGYSGDVYTVGNDESAHCAKILRTNVGYDSLLEAINNADNGDTIILLSDINLYHDLIITDNAITIDLNNYSIIDSGCSSGIFILGENSDLTLTGGKIDSRTRVAYLAANGKLTINGGTYSINNSNSTLFSDAWNNDRNTSGIIINSGHFESGKILSNYCGVRINGGSFGDRISFGGSYYNRFLYGGKYAANIAIDQYIVDGYLKTEIPGTEIPDYSGAVAYSIVENSDADPVARIGDTFYYSLEEAIDNSRNGDTIKIIKSINIGTLNIFGKQLIIDAGEISVTATGNTSILLGNRSNVEIIGGNWTYNRSDNFYGALFNIRDDTSLTIDGCRISSNNSPIFNVYGGEVIVNGGYYETGGELFYITTTDTCVGKAFINGGHFERGKINLQQGVNLSTWAVLRITGGTFGNNVSIITYENRNKDYKCICGGSFTKEFSTNISKGYKAISGVSGSIPGWSGTVYTVVKDDSATFEVKNSATNKSYYSIFDAVLEANEGEVLKLLKDVTISGRYVLVSLQIILDLNSHNLTFSDTESVILCGDSNVRVIGDGTVSNYDYSVSIWAVNSATGFSVLTIDGGKWTITRSLFSYNFSNGKVVINGGSFLPQTTNCTFSPERRFIDMEINGGAFDNIILSFNRMNKKPVIKGGQFGPEVTFCPDWGSYPYISGGTFAFNPQERDSTSIMNGYKVIVVEDSTVFEGVDTVYKVVSSSAGGGSAATQTNAPATARYAFSALAAIPLITIEGSALTADLMDAEESTSTSADGAVSVKFEDGTLTIYPTDGSEGSITAQELRGMIEAYASTASSVIVETTVKVTGETDGDYTNGLFAQFSAMVSADFSGLDIGDMTSLCGFFYGCSGMKSFDTTGWDFSGTDDMSYMFMGCSSATSILLRYTSSDYRAYPDTVAYMFNGCSKLRSLDLSVLYFYDESKETDGFTDGCTKLSSLTYPNDCNVCFGRGFYLPGTEWRHVESGDVVATEDFVTNNFDGSERYGTWVLNGDSYTIQFEAEESEAVLLVTSETFLADDDSSPLPMAYLANHKLTGWTDGENTFAPGAVIPANTYDAGTFVTLTAVFEENAATDENSSEYYFTLKGGETKMFTNLPASVQYEIWEMTEAGWSLVSSSNATGVIKPKETSRASFSNHYDPEATSAMISATKRLDGNRADSGAFSFTLHQVSGPETIDDLTKNNGAGGIISFGPIAYDTEGTYVYEISENAPDAKYTYDEHRETVTVTVATNTVNGVLEATVEYDSDGAVFENYTKPAEITVTKAITDDEATQNNAYGREFTFRITLTDGFERPLTGGYAMNADGELVPYVEVNGDKTELTDGIATITLKAGETATVGNVPEKTNYLVEETSLPAGWQTVGSGTASGKTAANGSYAVTITNTYVPGSRSLTFASFVAYKELVGDTLAKDMFSFTLRQISGPGYESFAPETVKNSALVSDEESEYYNKYGTIRFSDITYNAPGVYVYEVTENEPENANVEYDDHVLTYTVTVTDDGAGKLSSSVATEGETVFTNRMKTGSLRVEKTLENATEEAAKREFTFTLSFYDSTGTELTGEYDIRVYDFEGGLIRETIVTSGGNVSIKGGESFEVIDLPHLCSYTVEEEEAAGFIRTTVRGENVTEAERKAEGTVEAGSKDEVSFTNVYATVGTANPAVRKVLKGGTITANRFKFELRDEDGTVVDTAYAAEDGSISFTALDFTYEDDGKVLEYWVYEIDTGDSDVIYDLEPIKITVEVHDNGMGDMAAEVTYDAEDAREGVFTNYSAVDLTVTKKIRGDVFADEFEYTIEFTDSDGEAYDPGYVPENWTKLEAGKYSFTLADGETESVRIPYGTTYKIKETEGEYFQTYEVVSEKGMTHEFGDGGAVEREIGDHGNEDVIYYNSAFELEIEKELIGYTGEEELTFEFSAEFSIGDEAYDLRSMPEGWEKTGSGEYRFSLKSGESVKVSLPYGVTYKVTEIDPDDQYVKTCVITNDDGEEELDGGTAEHMIGDSGSEKVKVTNFRMEKLTIEKVVYGDDKEEIFVFTISFTHNGDPYDPEVPENWTKLEDGKYTFKLKDGKSVSVMLPYGATYELSEAADERFIAKVYLNGETEPFNTRGTVSERELTNNERITFANCETVTVTVKKTVKGDLSSTEKKFNFRLKLSEDGAANDLEETPEGFERVDEGEYEFKLAHGESVSFKLLGGMSYEISELDGVKYDTRYRIGEGEWTEGRTASKDNADASETILFENSYDSHIPTGVSVGMGGAALIALALAGTGAVLFKGKKKEE